MQYIENALESLNTLEEKKEPAASIYTGYKKKQKQSEKGGAWGYFQHPNAGNVEYNIWRFNHMHNDEVDGKKSEPVEAKTAMEAGNDGIGGDGGLIMGGETVASADAVAGISGSGEADGGIGMVGGMGESLEEEFVEDETGANGYWDFAKKVEDYLKYHKNDGLQQGLYNALKYEFNDELKELVKLKVDDDGLIEESLNEAETEEPKKDFNPLEQDEKFRYQLLSRCISDCKYFIEHPSENHLWAGNVKDQFKLMIDLYDSFDEKPEWTSVEEIEDLYNQMKGIPLN